MGGPLAPLSAADTMPAEGRGCEITCRIARGVLGEIPWRKAPEMTVDAIGSFWGKARPDSEAGPRWHPLAWHMLDVAASAQAILKVRPGPRRVMTQLVGLQEADAIRLAVLIAALHDIGKFAAPFQQKAIGPEWPFARPRDAQLGASQHDRDGLALWRHCLSRELANRIWPGAERALDRLIGASVGHHGRAVDTSHCNAAETFRPEGMAAAQTYAAALVDLLLPAPIDAPPRDEQDLGAATFWFAGFVTIADWAGSTQAYFRYAPPDIPIESYWRTTQDKATTAVRALGLAPARPSELKPSSAADYTALIPELAA